MEVKKNSFLFDKFVVIIYLLSVTTMMYFSSVSQSEVQDRDVVPIYVLLIPFGVAMLQLTRVIMIIGKFKTDALCRSWFYIFIYYVFALIMGILVGKEKINYNTAWLIICPPVAWWYFSLIIKAKPLLKDYIIILGFWFLIVLSFISLYFIPRSLNAMGLFASLNTGYYVLFIYPLAMLNSSGIKKVVSTVLMLIVILLSMKRGGWMAVAIAIFLYMLFAKKQQLYKKIVIAAISVGILFYIVPKVDEMTNGTIKARYEFTQNQNDEEGRVNMYPVVWKAVWDSSIIEIIFGHGHYAVVSNKILFGNSAHNDYLEFLYDYGIIGFILLLVYQWNLLVVTIRAHKKDKYFFPTLFSFSFIIVLSMVSIVYSFYYFLLIIPFWCVINYSQKERYYLYESRNLNIQQSH